MLQRIVTAVIGIPLLLVIAYEGGWVFQGLVLGLVVLGLYEMGRFIQATVYWDYLYAAGLSYLLLAYSNHDSCAYALYAWSALQLAYFLVRTTFTRGDPLTASPNVLAVLYVAVLYSFLWRVRADYGFLWLVFAIVVAWLTDAGGYFAGRLWGRTKLAPKISPNKTVEGAVGGAALAMCGGIVFGLLWTPSPVLLALLAAGLSGFGQVGDLTESAMKRQCTVKDSGHLIPGHGGILDRFDSLAFVLPGLYMVLLVLR